MSGKIHTALWAFRIGYVFHNFTVVGRASGRRGRALCRCICGNYRNHSWTALVRGLVKSCGCKAVELKRAAHTTHGKTYSPDYYLWSRARVRAQQSGLPFTIEISDVIIPDVCPVFGIPLRRSITGRAADDSPSLDRRDNTGGYTKENVRVISWRANRLKQTMTLAEARSLSAYIEGKL